jgi:hypothetical protein
MKTRVYLVSDGEQSRLVEAISIAQAIRHVVKSKFTTKVLSSVDTARAIDAGLRLEVANDTPALD